jgi:hypothetical protein
MAAPFLALITPLASTPGEPTHPIVPPSPGVPTHPIYTPSPGVPTHPIYIPGAPGTPVGPVDPGYGYPERPVDPGYGIPITGVGRPSHPIYYPPLTPTHPIVLPPGATLPPGIPTHPIVLPPEITPPVDPQRPIDWKVVWTPTTGWVVVGVPTGEHPTPSA